MTTNIHSSPLAFAPRLAWAVTGPLFLAALIVMVLVNWQALDALVRLWAFGGHDYGFLVLATSVWLIWRARDRLGELRPVPDWRGLLVVVPLSMGLWLAYLADIRLAQLALFVAGIGALAWTILGAAVFRVVAYPLAYFFLALPIWNYLKGVLQELTVHATVIGLKLIGMPVYVDETSIHIPRGAILVLAECSGAQYFQAGVTLGALYAYLNFRRPALRLAALGGFALMAIVGNWIRVYALIFLGRLTELQHFMVGWGIFAILLAVVLWLGARLERHESRTLQAAAPSNERTTARLISDPPIRPSIVSTLSLAALAVLLLASAPIAANLSTAPLQSAGQRLSPITVQSPWSGPFAPGETWRPSFTGADLEATAAYRKGEGEVTGYWAYYAQQRQGVEVINELNKVYDAARWRPRGGYAGTDYSEVRLADGTMLDVIETRLENTSTGAERLVWHWYRVGGRSVVRPWRAKLAQITGRIQGNRDALATVLSTDARDLSGARDLLREFVSANLRALQAVPSIGSADR